MGLTWQRTIPKEKGYKTRILSPTLFCDFWFGILEKTQRTVKDFSRSKMAHENKFLIIRLSTVEIQSKASTMFINWHVTVLFRL